MTRFLRNVFATLLLLTSFGALAATAQVRGEFASETVANALKSALSKSFGSEVKFSYPGETPAAGDGANFDHTGWAVAVAGDTALVGASSQGSSIARSKNFHETPMTIAITTAKKTQP